MNLKNVWMSEDTRKKSHYAQRTLGGIFGIVALILVLVLAGTLLILRFDWPRETSLMVLLLVIVALGIWLALSLGRHAVGNATVFFLTDTDRLYAMDARALSDHGHGVLGYAAGALETQKFLRQLAQQPHVPAGADEILSVTHIRETRTAYTVVCQVGRPNCHLIQRTYFLSNDLENLELLLRQMERRQHHNCTPEPDEKQHLLPILISALGFVSFTTLCVLSHPALNRLPRRIYFPCLATAFAALCLLLFFAVRQHRGESGQTRKDS